MVALVFSVLLDASFQDPLQGIPTALINGNDVQQVIFIQAVFVFNPHHITHNLDLADGDLPVKYDLARIIAVIPLGEFGHSC